MLIPRFSLRLMLIVTSASCLFSFVVHQGFQGQKWAVGLTVGLLGVAVAFLLYGLTFLAAWMMTCIWSYSRRKPADRSPFAADGPPPQLLPPIDPE